MFDTLLESRPRSAGSARGTLASITAHAAVVAAAVLATSQVSVHAPKLGETMHPVYFPPQPIAAPAVTPSSHPDRHQEARLPRPIDVGTLANVPALDVLNLSSIAQQLAQPAIPATSYGVQSGNTLARQSNGVFQESQVEKPAALVAGSASPRYPETLRASGVEGRVLAVFVVDERGRAEVDSARFMTTDDRLFEDAARAALRRMKFAAAEIGGRKVRQLVQMPFVFTIDR